MAPRARSWPQALPSRARARCSLWAARDHAEHRRATALAGVGARLPDELRSLAPLGAVPLYDFHLFLKQWERPGRAWWSRDDGAPSALAHMAHCNRGHMVLRLRMRVLSTAHDAFAEAS